MEFSEEEYEQPPRDIPSEAPYELGDPSATGEPLDVPEQEDSAALFTPNPHTAIPLEDLPPWPELPDDPDPYTDEPPGGAAAAEQFAAQLAEAFEPSHRVPLDTHYFNEIWAGLTVEPPDDTTPEQQLRTRLADVPPRELPAVLRKLDNAFRTTAGDPAGAAPFAGLQHFVHSLRCEIDAPAQTEHVIQDGEEPVAYGVADDDEEAQALIARGRHGVELMKEEALVLTVDIAMTNVAHAKMFTDYVGTQVTSWLEGRPSAPPMPEGAVRGAAEQLHAFSAEPEPLVWETLIADAARNIANAPLMPLVNTVVGRLYTGGEATAFDLARLQGSARAQERYDELTALGTATLHDTLSRAVRATMAPVPDTPAAPADPFLSLDFPSANSIMAQTEQIFLGTLLGPARHLDGPQQEGTLRPETREALEAARQTAIQAARYALLYLRQELLAPEPPPWW